MEKKKEKFLPLIGIVGTCTITFSWILGDNLQEEEEFILMG